MCRIIYLGQMLEIQRGIDLCRCNGCMPQHFLYGAQVTGGLENVRGEGMPKVVGMYIDGQPETSGVILYPQLDKADGHAMSAAS